MDGVLTPSCAAPRQPEALADIARDASIADALAAARELLGMERAYLAEAGEPAAEGHLAVPVRLRDGTVYGSLCCVPRPAAPELERPAEQMLEVLARVIADQIEHQLDRRRTTRLEGEAIAGQALLAALKARERYTAQHSEAVVGIATAVAEELGLSEVEVIEVAQVALLPRHRQAGRPRRDPAEARPALAGRVADHARASGDGRARRRLDPLARAHRARRARGARALGRARLPRRPRRGGHPARQPDLPRVRRVARDDLRPPVPPRHERGRRSRRAPPPRRRPPARGGAGGRGGGDPPRHRRLDRLHLRWEREQHRLRTLINVGDLRGTWERFPADEVYALDVYPAVERLLHEGLPYVHQLDDPTLPAASKQLLEELGMAAGVGVPVVVEGRIWGTLDILAAPGGTPLSARSVPFLEAIAGQVGAAIGRAELFAHVSALAFTDPLTGLANRRALDERMESAIARGVAVAVAFCDLDGLKEINDAAGHEAGDAAIRRAAEALAAAAARHAGSFVGRIGGDECCLLLEGAGARALGAVAEAASSALAAHDLTFSCGVAALAPGDRPGRRLPGRRRGALRGQARGSRGGRRCGRQLRDGVDAGARPPRAARPYARGDARAGGGAHRHGGPRPGGRAGRAPGAGAAPADLRPGAPAVH
jgi:diguanylate cyclase (GGDEF)-like protein